MTYAPWRGLHFAPPWGLFVYTVMASGLSMCQLTPYKIQNRTDFIFEKLGAREQNMVPENGEPNAASFSRYRNVLCACSLTEHAKIISHTVPAEKLRCGARFRHCGRPDVPIVQGS